MAAEVQGSSLCVACQSIFQPATLKSDSGEVAHHGLEALAARASKCHLCLTVFMSIDPEAYRNFRKDSTVETVGFAWISPIARDQARLKFRYLKPVTAHRATPSTSSSKTSLGPLGDTGLVVELILMNPKCKCFLFPIRPEGETLSRAHTRSLQMLWNRAYGRSTRAQSVRRRTKALNWRNNGSTTAPSTT